MLDFNLGQVIGLMGRTLPFLGLRLAIYLGFVVALVLFIGLGAGVGWGVGGLFGPDGPVQGAAWGGIAGFGIVGGAMFLAREYVLYLVKAAHIAVLVELLDGGEIPGGQSQIRHGREAVQARFVQSSVLFGLDRLIAGVISSLIGLLRAIPLPGLNGVVGIIRAFLKVALGFVDEIILAYAIRTRSDDPWRSARDALVLYGQNYKAIIKNAAVLAVIVYALSFVIFLLALAPAAALVYLIPGPWSAGGFVLAVLIAWAVKAALIEPVAVTCLMQAYFRVIEGQTPDPAWEARLNQLSKPFRVLAGRAQKSDTVSAAA